MSACTPDCNAPDEGIDELEFLEQTLAGTELIVAKTTTTGQSYAWGSGELALLPDTELTQTLVRYTPATEDTEVSLFAVDPAFRRDDLEGLFPGDYDAGICGPAAVFNTV